MLSCIVLFYIIYYIPIVDYAHLLHIYIHIVVLPFTSHSPDIPSKPCSSYGITHICSRLYQNCTVGPQTIAKFVYNYGNEWVYGKYMLTPP